MVFHNRLMLYCMYCLCCIPLSASADDFDGSRPLSGTVIKIIEIKTLKITDNVDPDTVGLPRKFLIDFKEKLLRPSKDSLVRKTVRIKSIEHIESSADKNGLRLQTD